MKMKHLFGLLAVCATLSVLVSGCSRDKQEGGGDTFISIGTAPQGGVFYTVGAAVADVLDQADGTGWRKVTAESTAGSLENLRRLDSNEIQLAMSNSTITYFAVRGEGGFDKKYDVKSIMTINPLIAMFVTRADANINSIQDLKGKRVVVGPEAAGFEHFIGPILEEHGVSYEDIDEVYQGMGSSVGLLQDGSVDATFLGGGIKAPAITNADTTMDIVLVPYGETERQALLARLPSFSPATIPANTYQGQTEPFNGLNVGSAHLIVRSDADEDFVYKVTKIIYENRAKIAEKHAAARAITPENVVRETGTEFHPGAIKFYREIGIWPDGDKPTEPEETKDGEPSTSEPEKADE